MTFRAPAQVAAAAGALLFAACGNGEPPPSNPVSREEAEAQLVRAVELAANSTPEELCAAEGVVSGHCEASLETGGGVPPSPPVVLGERRIVPDPYPATILEVCGTRLDGTVYFTDFIVYRERGALLVRDPVYWSGVSVGSAEGELTAAPNPPEETPRSCPG